MFSLSAIKKKWFYCLSVVLLLLFAGCSNPEGQSRALYDTAQFEEMQMNFKHAKQLYNEILRDYPESSFASKAKDRLVAIESEQMR